ncbi:hypothetical protein BGX26_006737, partial [Mortierella sp. AD094]
MSEQKHESTTKKEFVDEKFDVERSSTVLEEEDISLITEVAAIVSNKDDSSHFIRTHPMTLTALVIQLVPCPIGKFMARVLPHGILNPGPFNFKEHVLITLCFSTLGYIPMAQSLTIVSDLKLSHYMKIPPRAIFWAQLMGTAIAGLVNMLTAIWLLMAQP